MAENFMKYNHMKLKAINCIRFIFLNYTIMVILSVFTFSIIKENLHSQFTGKWYVILVIIFCLFNILHFLISSIILSIKQFKYEKKEISKNNHIVYNESLFKMAKVENIVNFYLINFLNLAEIIFLINILAIPAWQFTIHILILFLNIFSTNIIIFRFWIKTK